MAADSLGVENFWEGLIGDALGDLKAPVRARVADLLAAQVNCNRSGSYSVVPVQHPLADDIDCIARQIVAMAQSCRHAVDKVVFRNQLMKLRSDVFLRRSGEEAFQPLNDAERKLVNQAILELQFREERLETGLPGLEPDFATIRHNHLQSEGARVSPEQFRASADRIIATLVGRLIKESRFNTDDTVIALPWLSALPLGAAFAKHGFRRFVHIDMTRDKNTFQTAVGHVSQNEQLHPGDIVIVPDPLLATGNTVAEALGRLRFDAGKHKALSLSMIAAPEGVFSLADVFPSLRFRTAAMDTHLNSEGLVCPGLGDFATQYFANLNSAECRCLIDQWCSLGLLSWTEDIGALKERLAVI